MLLKHVLATTALTALVSLSACSSEDAANTDEVPSSPSAETTEGDSNQKGIAKAESGRATATMDLRTVAGQVESDMWTGDGYSTNSKDMSRSIESATISKNARVRSYGLSDESFQLCLVNDPDGVWAYYDSTDGIIETGEGDRCS